MKGSSGHEGLLCGGLMSGGGGFRSPPEEIDCLGAIFREGPIEFGTQDNC